MKNSAKLLVKRLWQPLRQATQRSFYSAADRRLTAKTGAAGLLLGTVLAVVYAGLIFAWDEKPEPMAVQLIVQRYVAGDGEPVVGQYTTAALAHVTTTLLDKPGGYLSNDLLSPGLFMDNMPNFEFGMLVMARDLSQALRNHFSRSQTQSVEVAVLADADPNLHFSNDSWLFPPTEGRYSVALEQFTLYLQRLSDATVADNEFYARADNLRAWLAVVEKRLGSFSQRLSASAGRRRINTDLAGDAEAQQSTQQPREVMVKTGWTEVDNIFYEAQGATWALLHFLRGVEVDFAKVLEKKNALVSLRQIIRELEQTQQRVWAPAIMSGTGFGMFANHSLVMANYISRANAAVIDLRNLLEQG